jgi:hypothetical protein
MASVLIPNAGTVNECKTSAELTKNINGVLEGRISRLFTSNKRKPFSNLFENPDSLGVVTM